jgi:hypothetical protein
MLQIGANNYPIDILFAIVLATIIVFAPQIPLAYRDFLDTIAGRVIGLVAILAIVQYSGWIYGLLAALAYLVALHVVPRDAEGFTSQIVKETIGRRWYVERVLGERPELIDTEKVTTTVVSDNSQKAMSARI